MPSPGPAHPLRQRGFTLLWSADVVSELGSQATTVAMPLLALALTHSAAKAGIVGFAQSLAYPLTTLPAGVLADRVDRRRILISTSLMRALAMASLPLVLAFGHPPLVQLMAVAFADAGLWSVARIAERGLLTAIVDPGALPDAIAANEAREAVGVIGGPPLGGALFGVARALPFTADAASSVAAALLVAGVRPRRLPPETEPHPADRATLRRDVGEGMAWLWRNAFLRDGSLLYAAGNLTLAAGLLLAVLVARHEGASSTAIGVAFTLIGCGGIAGSVIAGPLRRRLGPRWSVLAEPWLVCASLPFLLLCRSALAVGAVFVFLYLPVALSSSVVVGQRLTLTPDPLRGRVQASASFIGGSIAWVGPLVIGFVFQDAGEAAAILTLTGWAFAVALAATASRGLRSLPASG